jgi:hypothetical protein
VDYDCNSDLDAEKLDQFMREALSRQNVSSYRVSRQNVDSVQLDEGSAAAMAEANAEFIANVVIHQSM